MPVWFSPRGRLGMMAAVIVLIVCAVLLTRARNDSNVGPGPVPLDVAIEQIAASPSVLHTSPVRRPSVPIPVDVFTPSSLKSPFGLSGVMPGLPSLTITPDNLPSQLVSDLPLDWPHELLAQNIGPLGCSDCTALHSSFSGFRSGGYAGGGGVGGSTGAGAGGGSGAAAPGEFLENLDTTPLESLFNPGSPNGPSENQGSSGSEGAPPGEPNRNGSPNHLVSYGPPGQEPVSVPEPSTMVLLGMSVAAALAGRGFTGKRRG